MVALGIALSLLSPLVGLCFSLLYFASYKKPLAASLMFGFSVACLFYGMQTDSSSDVYRHMLLLSNYQSVGLFECFGASYYENLFAWDFLNWIVARFGNPYLLQCTCAFVSYTLFSYIVFDYAAKNGWRRLVWLAVLLTLICVIPFISVVQGLRNALAFAIGSFAIYRYYESTRSIYQLIGLLVIATLVHHSAFVLLVFVALMIPAKSKPVSMALAVFFGTFLLGALAQVLLPYLSGGNIVFSIASDVLSVFSHYEQGTEWTAAHGSSFNTRVNNYALMAILALLNVRLFVGKGLLRVKHKRTYSDASFSAQESCVPQLSLVTSSFAIAMIAMLPANGDRFVIVAACFAVLAFGSCCQATSHSKSAGAFIFDAVVAACVLGCFALHAYSIYYNMADVFLFVSNVFLGPIFSSVFF